MAGRPGLYQELVKYDLLWEAWHIVREAGSDADKAELFDIYLADAGSDFTVSPRAVFIVRHRLLNEPKPEPPKRKKRRKPNDGSFKPGNPGGPGAPIGNDNATLTGRDRHPFIHDPEWVEWRREDRLSPDEQRWVLQLYDQRLKRLGQFAARLKLRMAHLESEWRRMAADLRDAEEAIKVTKSRRSKATAKLR